MANIYTIVKYLLNIVVNLLILKRYKMGLSVDSSLSQDDDPHGLTEHLHQKNPLILLQCS
jgi:hypothetical protein